MLSRGFQGDMPALKRSHILLPDLAFLSVIIASLWVFRFFPITEGIGRLAEGVLR
jgi:hypothetical protein